MPHAHALIRDLRKALIKGASFGVRIVHRVWPSPFVIWLDAWSELCAGDILPIVRRDGIPDLC